MASSVPTGMRRGALPSSGTIQRAYWPARLEEKMMDRLSEDQAIPLIVFASCVIWRGVPPEVGIQYKSMTQLSLARRKAIFCPSGEKTGLRSPSQPDGGVVSACARMDSTSIR